MLRLTRIALALFAVAVTASLVAPGTAQARLISAAEATCWPGRIFVSAPAMETNGGGVFVAPDGTMTINPTQWVAFRVQFTKLVGSRWTTVATGPWFAREVTQAGGFGDYWVNLSTNRWGSATTTYTPTSTGSYRVWIDYYWYANRFYASAAFGDYTWKHYDYRSGYLSVAYQYCNY